MSGTPEVVKGSYNPYFKFRFEVLEYVRGNGADELTVLVYTEPRSDVITVKEESFEEVQCRAESIFSQWRDASWDDREALIFLKHADFHLIGDESDYMEFTSRLLTPDVSQYAISSTHTKA